VSPRELLQLALERRDRTWGQGNADAIARMREEVARVNHRPALRAVACVKYFAGREAIGFGDGCYMRDQTSARTRLDLN
jgi:hypothetical protein